jgi:hypothetical protein
VADDILRHIEVVIPLDSTGKPFRHWSGRTLMAKVIQQFINDHKPVHLTENEATDLAELASHAYLTGVK